MKKRTVTPIKGPSRLIPLGVAALAALIFWGKAETARAAERRPLNVLLFTADDLNCDSLGCYGGKVPDVTPNLDRFAAAGMRFERAHVNVAICQPSRGVLATGRYSHRSGITGFYHTNRDIPTIMETLRSAGYLTGILGKVEHSTPKDDYKWDFSHDQGELGQGRDPSRYYTYSREFLGRSRENGRPFYFMVNSHDPHRPFHDPKNPPYPGEAVAPSRLYSPEDVTIPGFLPDLPGVRLELSHYFNSVRRCDDTFGAVMKALHESGLEDDTVVVFLSDNGIAVPFAKCNCYLASTRTPLMIRWPGVVKSGSVDSRHFVSGIDFFPTILEAAGLPRPGGLDGDSLLTILKGGAQEGRERVFTQIDHQAGGSFVPMRAVQDKKYGYIFTPWSDGKFRYRNNNEGLSMKAMEAAAATDPWIASRVALFRFRKLEELYDLEEDPSQLRNLINDPQHAAVAARMRNDMLAWMKRTEDPALAALEHRDSPTVLQQFMTDPEKGDAGAGAKKKPGGKKRKGR